MLNKHENYFPFVTTKKNASIINVDDLKLIWKIISKNWYLPILIIPVFYLLGFFYTYKLTNVFSASVELLKSNDTYYKNNLITDNSFYGATGQSYIDNSNEIRIIKSFDLMKKTIEKLKDRLQISYYFVGRVRTTEQFGAMPFSVKINNINPELYEQSIDFRIIDYQSYEIQYLSKGNLNKLKGEFGTELINLDFNLLIDRSGNFNKNTVNVAAESSYQFIVHSDSYLVNKYQSSLQVENPDYTNVLVIKIEDIIPERAVLILDTLSQVYINKSLQDKIDINERTVSFIDKQLDEIKLSLNDIEDTMQSYKSKNAILDIKWEQEDFFKKIAEYDNEKSKLNLKLSAINDLEKYIIEDKDPQFLPPNIFLVDNDKFLIESVSELYKLQLELNNKYSFAKEDNPDINNLKQSIKKLKQNMLVYLNNTRNATSKISENINSQLDQYVGRIKLLPEKQRNLFGIQRKVDVNEQLYTFLLQNRASTKIAKASIVPEIKIIDKPRNLGLANADKKKTQSTFILIGLIVSVIIIVIKSIFFTKIENIEELKDATFIPILGDLPFIKNHPETGIICDKEPNSFLAESFRTIRTNLNYSNLNKQKNSNTILVTSNVPGEGKTFTIINLGTTIAKGGKRVLMLELDLHKPRIQKALEMTADIGISTYMAGETDIASLVKNTGINNLFTILSGPIPPNPSELILSDRLKDIIDFAKEHFDYVLIDTPPAGLLSDALFMMQYADTNLFVVNTKFATKKSLNVFHKAVKDNNIKNVYLILNGVKRKRNKYYAGGYYGYGYGYGYGKA